MATTNHGDLYRVTLDTPHPYLVEAISPAIANRLARDQRNAHHLNVMDKMNNDRERAKYFSKHKAEIEGPRTAVVALAS
jgi:hypothetical protein